MAWNNLSDLLESRPVKWHDKSVISIISLVIATLLCLLSLMFFYFDHDFGSRVLLALASAALSVWITLFVVNLALKEDRNQNWVVVKSYTYSIILWHICLTACLSLLVMRPLSDSIFTMEGVRIVGGGHLYPKKEVANALLDISDLLRVDYVLRERHDDARRAHGEQIAQDQEIKRGLTLFYNISNWRFETIRMTLIPRVLQLSDDKDVFNALLKYETKIEEFEDVMRQSTGRMIIGSDIEGLARLIESSAPVYETIRKNILDLQELNRLMETDSDAIRKSVTNQ
jgi:hypothetical protein